jgi:hypothetical protein
VAALLVCALALLVQGKDTYCCSRQTQHHICWTLGASKLTVCSPDWQVMGGYTSALVTLPAAPRSRAPRHCALDSQVCDAELLVDLHKSIMGLNELDAHTWRALALLLPNPTSFASCCRRASKVVGDKDFRLEWFAAYHRCAWPTACASSSITTYLSRVHYCLAPVLP